MPQDSVAAGPVGDGGGETQSADHIAALAVTAEDDGGELTLSEVLAAGFKALGYAWPKEAACEAVETIAAGPLPPPIPASSADRIARAIFDHPLMQAVERAASERWHTKAEQLAVAEVVARLPVPSARPVGRAEIARWRNDALEKAAEIVRRYEPFADDAVRDILALRDRRPGTSNGADAIQREGVR